MHWKEDSGLELRSLHCGKKTVPTSLSLSLQRLFPEKVPPPTEPSAALKVFFLFFKIKLIIFIASSRIFSQLY